MSIDGNGIAVDTKSISFAKLRKSLETALGDIMAKHSRNHDAGKAPDGSAQKKNSDDYAALKRSTGIQVGGQKFRGSLPTILTGEMKNSRQVVTRPGKKSVQIAYNGSDNVKKARNLVKRRYKLNELGDADVQYIENAVNDEVGKLLEKTFRVTKL